MTAKISAKQAKNILRTKDKSKHFYAKNGKTLKNLHDLKHSVSKMDGSTFKHHVNDSRNDFSNWVMDVHEDEDLAQRLSQASTQRQIKSMVNSRIKQLEGAMKADKKQMAKDELKQASQDKKSNMVLEKASLKLLTNATRSKAKKASGVKVVKKIDGSKSKNITKLAIHKCPTKYFLKCSSVHFTLGVIAGFLLGFVIATAM